MNDTSSPWVKKSLNRNLISLILLITLGTIIISLRTTYPIIYLPMYFICWVFYFTVGSYFTCRHCDFLGKPCPSWNKGIIAGKIFKRSDKKNFMEIPQWQMFIFAIGPLMIGLFSPYIPFIIIFIDPVRKMAFTDNILLPLYVVLELIVIWLHSRGCKNCPISECPLNRQGQK